MIRIRVYILASLLYGGPVWSIYAPIAKPSAPGSFSAEAYAGISYDTNIFGAPSNAIASTIYEVAPRFAYQFSPSPQTFLLASYQLTLDYVENRPGEKLLDNHDVELRAVHAFNAESQLDVSDLFQRSRNPEALLNGLPYNTDQSLNRNQFDARYTFPLGTRSSVLLKVRDIYFDYDATLLGQELNRSEDVAGVEFGYSLLPTTKLVAEFRHQDVLYITGGSDKDKFSDFAMMGFDYAAGPHLVATARAGAEYRRREGESDTTAPYLEATIHYDYAARSFVSAGYIYTLEETSDIIRFDDTRIHRFFAGWQHAVTPLVLAAATLAVEPSELHGRTGQPDVAETALRAGVQLSYYYSRHWTFSVTYDYDRVHSDDPSRNLRRSRAGALVGFIY